jgi:hypothetical protein
MMKVPRRLFILSAFVALLAAAGPPVPASEPAPELQVNAHVERLGPGHARLSITLESFAEARDIQIEILQADGSPLPTPEGPFAPSTLRWARSASATIVDVANGAAALGRGESARVSLRVPLVDRAPREIIVRATARDASGQGSAAAAAGQERVLRTEDALWIGGRAGSAGPIDDGTVAEFDAAPAPGGR